MFTCSRLPPTIRTAIYGWQWPCPGNRADLDEFQRELIGQIVELIDAQLTKRLGEVEEQFNKRLTAAEEHLVEQLRDNEAKLLRGFYQHQEHVDVRMRKMPADISNMDTASDLRLNNLERRVIEAERKILESGR